MQKIQKIYPIFILNHSHKNFKNQLIKTINKLYKNNLSYIDKLKKKLNILIKKITIIL